MLDLEQLDKKSLIELEVEVDYTVACIQGRVEWSNTSQPSEWPDEDWPRRVVAALVFHKKILKRIRRILAYKREEEQMKKQPAIWESKKAIQENHHLHQERLRKISYLKTRYVFKILSEKCGKAFADQVFEEAKALANSNVDSATWEE